jgi:hypothetical protein
MMYALNRETLCTFCQIPYSGKFSLMQNFAELHVSPSEEDLIACVTSRFICFRGFYFAAPSLSAKMQKYPAIRYQWRV